MTAGAHKQQPYLGLNPYGRVPTLQEDDFVLYESTSILDYLEATHPAPALVPTDAQGRALVSMHMKLCDLQLARQTDTNTFTVTRLDTSAGSEGSITFQQCTLAGSPVTGATKVGNCKWNIFTSGGLSFLRFSFNFLIPGTSGNWGQFVLVNTNNFGRFARFWRAPESDGIGAANGNVATARADDHGDTSETATAIESNSMTDGVLDEESDIDVFSLELTTAGQLTVKTVGEVDTLGALVDSDGTVLAMDDNTGAGTGNF